MSGEDLARRAVACAGWMPGMRTIPEKQTGRVFRAIRDEHMPVRFIREAGPSGFGWGLDIDRTRGGAAVFWFKHVDPDETNEVALPDLDDAATVGCLEGRLFESWPGARISIKVDPWVTAGPLAEIVIRTKFGEPPRSFVARGPRARVEAIIAALEAAPKTGGAS